MKKISIVFLFVIALHSCKSKDGCDNTYSDCTNSGLAKDIGIWCGSVDNNSIEIINASCKTLSTSDYTLGIEGNQEAYKLPSTKLESGKHIIYSNLPFTINKNGDIIYLKHKGSIVGTLGIH